MKTRTLSYSNYSQEDCFLQLTMREYDDSGFIGDRELFLDYEITDVDNECVGTGQRVFMPEFNAWLYISIEQPCTQSVRDACLAYAQNFFRLIYKTTTV